MSTTLSMFERQQIADLAKQKFRDMIEAKLQVSDRGRFLAIDSLTGDFEIDDDDFLALTRLGERVDPQRIYLMKVGYPTAYRLTSMTSRSIT